MMSAGGATAQARRRFTPEDIVDVFVYVVVLNLATQFLPSVVSETFTMSIFTAVLLKVVLEIVLKVKDRVKSRFKGAASVAGQAFAGVSLLLLLMGSKFVILELVSLIFRDHVSLGGFWSVTALILCLVFSRAGVRRLLA